MSPFNSVDPSAYISSINILNKEDVKAVLKLCVTRLRVQRAVAPTRVFAQPWLRHACRSHGCANTRETDDISSVISRGLEFPL